MGKFLLLLLVIGVVTYLIVRTIETRGHPFRRTPGGGFSRLPRPPRRPSRPLAPDDDVEFLRDLNRRRPRRADPDQPE
ncbi:hypothetical protein [Nocardioides daejeonensis]|uniref:hypothetical protein n=1 Tax=Nocardioides daejeonensis TaxID=1046556 RepID=UPI000D7415B8|nr:hypothetical protein [Nocardioides daejeonensis]